jgi:hypothetical protein
LYWDTIAKALRKELGTVGLIELTARDVQGALAAAAIASPADTRTNAGA